MRMVFAESLLEESRRPVHDPMLDFARLSLEFGYALFFTAVWPLTPLACLVASAIYILSLLRCNTARAIHFACADSALRTHSA